MSAVSAVHLLKKNKEGIQRAYERYLIIKELAAHKTTVPLPEHLIQPSGKINLVQDNIHILQLASAFNKKPQELVSQIELAQRLNREKTFARLKKEHPSLAEYDTLFKERFRGNETNSIRLNSLLSEVSNSYTF